ncbi:hypothetical protein L228DRAFT_176898 [Xylona heveae TC161]|uniref:WD40 repeat-like protein n=1 Tax=Xylona heveae (strain CBS 132557 / TC161) TaxID=1328760 RepID=A0A165F7P4_XYLHT|nr:hypothetical protein L228DRAFT_176898 [Xylona heveae TC161]KZF20672.1 hypothetical protein L228DRAFT_176898 [Xylona heveae TC161]
MEKRIPGYYFDPEKRKYFKILPNHAAPASQYSRQNVSKVQYLERKRKRDERDEARLKMRITRSRILNHPLAGALSLPREHGQELRPAALAKTYATGLSSERLISSSDPRGEKIGQFARDPETGGLFFSTIHSGVSKYMSIAPKWSSNGEPEYSKIRGWHLITPPSASEITSVNIGKTRTLMSTTLGGTTQSTVHLAKLVDPSCFDGSLLDVGAHVLLKPPGQTSIWTSAPSKTDGNIAIGTSSGINLLQESLSNWTELKTIHYPTDVFALEFLSASTIAAGLRDNSVRLYDQRSSGKSLRLRHRSAVTGIKQVDDCRILVCGLKNSVSPDRRCPCRSDTIPSPHLFPETRVSLFSFVSLFYSLSN